MNVQGFIVIKMQSNLIAYYKGKQVLTYIAKTTTCRKHTGLYIIRIYSSSFSTSWFLCSQEQQEEDQVSHRSSTSRLSRSPLRGVKKVKIMQCKVTLLDGSDYTLNVEVRPCRCGGDVVTGTWCHFSCTKLYFCF